MTQEEKDLLIKDLCGRLPYGVKYKDAHGNNEILNVWSKGFYTALNTILYDDRPSLYLRPMSSMTEEEEKELVAFHCVNIFPIIMDSCLTIQNENKMFDWLNSHHFDYRGLIEKGLALEAPEGMYKTKQ